MVPSVERKKGDYPYTLSLLFTAVFLLCLIAISATAVAAPFGYVSNAGSNAVYVIDLDTNAVVATVPVGAYPDGAAVSPDGSRAYVANGDSASVSVINTATNSVVATVGVGQAPHGLAVSPDGSRVYVTNPTYDSGANPQTVSVINTATNSVVATVGVGNSPNSVAFSPDGSQAYVTNGASATVSVINTATNSVVATVGVGTGPSAVAFSLDGSRAYVANMSSNTVSVINTATNSVVATVGVGNAPSGVAFSPDGSRVYVANMSSNAVSVIDTATNSVVATVGIGSGQSGVAFSPDGSRAYVTNGSNTISVIDTATNSVVATIAGGTTPNAVSIQYSGYPLSVYVAAGASIAALLDAGFTTAQLLAAGVTQAQLDAAGVGVPGLGYGGMVILLTLLCGYWLRRHTKVMKLLVNSKGFTLIEIILVLGIIGILASILAPALTKHIGGSSISKAEADVKNIGGAIGKMYSDTGNWPVWQSGTATKSSDNKFYLLASSDGAEPDKASGITDWVTVDETIGDQLVDNAVSYPTTGRRAWKGPYLREDRADPWGNKYLVNAKFLHPGRVTGAKPVFVLSAGPNKLIETAFSQTGPSVTIGGDDIVCRLK